jgi:formate/nitrite transporter FocA (FNT family)
MALLQAGLPEAPWRNLVAGFGYTLGFLIVILGRQQLFTESTLTPVLPVLTGPSWQKLPSLFRFWAVVLATNLVGTWLFAWAICHEGLFKPEVWKALNTIADEVVADAFWPMAVKAVLAGWLIALMVWLLPVAQAARIWVIIILTYLIGVAHFPHIIAGSIETFYLGASGLRSWGEVLGGYALPTLLGNTLGGVALVAALAHAQIAGDRDKQREGS